MQQFLSFPSWRLFTAQHVSGVFPPIIRSSLTAVAASGFTFVSWWQSCCVRGRVRPDHEHSTTVTKVKREAATAVIELLMMGGKTPATCWAVNKRQDGKLRNCCIWLVLCLNWKMNTLRCSVCYVTKYWNGAKCTDKFLGAFAKFRIATVNFVASVCLFACNYSAPIGWIFVKRFTFKIFFWRSVEKFNVLSKSDRTKCTLCGDECRLW
jgi:hypothetical protein